MRSRLITRLHEPNVLRLRFWLWLLVAYLVVVIALLILGGQVEGPAPRDIGWSS